MLSAKPLPSQNEFYEASTKLMDIVNKSLKPSKELETAYQVVLASVSNSPLKSLVAAAIPKYFPFFPSCQDAALDAHLDLCEDHDPKIRIAAIRGLPLLCKDIPRFVPKVADVLCQLLQAEQADEQVVVKAALISCWTRSPKAMGQIPEVRTPVIKFIANDLNSPAHAPLVSSSDPTFFLQFSSDLQKLLKLGSLEPKEFESLMVLFKTKIAPQSRPEHFEQVVGVFVAAMDLPKPYDTQSESCFTKLKDCLNGCAGLFKRGAKATQFVTFAIQKILQPALYQAFPNDAKRTLALRSLSDSLKWGFSAEIAPGFKESLKTLILTFDFKEGGPAKELSVYCRLECVLFCLYELTLQYPDTFSPIDSELIGSLRSIYSACVAYSSVLAKANNVDEKERRAFENSFCLVKELLKPVKLRTRLLNFVASWRTKEPPAITAPATTTAPKTATSNKRPISAVSRDPSSTKKAKTQDNSSTRPQTAAVPQAKGWRPVQWDQNKTANITGKVIVAPASKGKELQKPELAKNFKMARNSKPAPPKNMKPVGKTQPSAVSKPTVTTKRDPTAAAVLKTAPTVLSQGRVVNATKKSIVRPGAAALGSRFVIQRDNIATAVNSGLVKVVEPANGWSGVVSASSRTVVAAIKNGSPSKRKIILKR
ncbi:hypothetical protein HDU97_001529 [Phlyctochytrium planicorne]|nr:hypothetical protein HDU97_001529 [Phlyctochytrium planicorne]